MVLLLATVVAVVFAMKRMHRWSSFTVPIIAENPSEFIDWHNKETIMAIASRR